MSTQSGIVAEKCDWRRAGSGRRRAPTKAKRRASSPDGSRRRSSKRTSAYLSGFAMPQEAAASTSRRACAVRGARHRENLPTTERPTANNAATSHDLATESPRPLTASVASTLRGTVPERFSTLKLNLSPRGSTGRRCREVTYTRTCHQRFGGVLIGPCAIPIARNISWTKGVATHEEDGRGAGSGAEAHDRSAKAVGGYGETGAQLSDLRQMPQKRPGDRQMRQAHNRLPRSDSPRNKPSGLKFIPPVVGCQQSMELRGRRMRSATSTAHARAHARAHAHAHEHLLFCPAGIVHCVSRCASRVSPRWSSRPGAQHHHSALGARAGSDSTCTWGRAGAHALIS